MSADQPSLFEVIVAIVGVLLVGWQIKLQRAVNALERERHESELLANKSATIRAEIIRGNPDRYPQVIFTNDGPAKARDIEILLDGQPIAESKRISKKPWPMPNDLAAGVDLRLFVFHVAGYGIDRFKFTVRWTDATDSRREEEFDLTA